MQGSANAEWGVAKKGWKTAYMLLNSSIEYDKSVCYGFELGFKAAGGKIVGQNSFKNDDPSIATQITRLKAVNPAPDVIEICSYPPGGASAVRQIRAAGVKTALAGDNAMDGGYWLSAVPDLSDFYFASLGSVVGGDPRPGIDELREKIIAKYKDPPPISQSYMGYSMMQLYAAAVEKAKTTEPKAVVAGFRDFPGSTHSRRALHLLPRPAYPKENAVHDHGHQQRQARGVGALEYNNAFDNERPVPEIELIRFLLVQPAALEVSPAMLQLQEAPLGLLSGQGRT